MTDIRYRSQNTSRDGKKNHAKIGYITVKVRSTNFGSKCLKGFLYSNLILFALGMNSARTFASQTANISARPSRLSYDKAITRVRGFDFESLRLAITDLLDTFGQRYPKGPEYLERLNSLKESSEAVLSSFNRDNDSAKAAVLKLAADLNRLRYDALLSNPLLDFDRLLLLKRKRGQLGLPVNHKCNSGISPTGYDNEIAVLGPIHEWQSICE